MSKKESQAVFDCASALEYIEVRIDRVKKLLQILGDSLGKLDTALTDLTGDRYSTARKRELIESCDALIDATTAVAEGARTEARKISDSLYCIHKIEKAN